MPWLAPRLEYGYYGHVARQEAPLRTVNVAELKNRLSHYLDQVRAGEEVIVRNRKRPIAKIVPLSEEDWEAERQELIAAGLLKPAEGKLPKSFWKMPVPRVPAKAAAAALRWARGDR